MKTEKYNVTGMTCAACQANVTRCVLKVDGVSDVNVSLLANQMTVTYDENQTDDNKIISAVQQIGYGASSVEENEQTNKNGFRSEWQQRQERALSSQKAMKARLLTSIILLIPLMYIAMGHMLHIPVPSIFIGTENALISALTQLILTLSLIHI